jgi:hypothetical protein
MHPWRDDQSTDQFQWVEIAEAGFQDTGGYSGTAMPHPAPMSVLAGTRSRIPFPSISVKHRASLCLARNIYILPDMLPILKMTIHLNCAASVQVRELDGNLIEGRIAPNQVFMSNERSDETTRDSQYPLEGRAASGQTKNAFIFESLMKNLTSGE